LVLDPPAESSLFTEEVFGPILPILSYETEEVLDKVLSELKNPLAFTFLVQTKNLFKKCCCIILLVVL
jgi:aldehyde dehydrogenase (NAD+)